MTLSLFNIKSSKGSIKKRKRVGRGNSSGHGTYSTRGQKGQKSRTGGKNKLKRLGFKKIMQSIPKSRGFKSAKLKNQTIKLDNLNKYFTDGAKINISSLIKAGLIHDYQEPVKILSGGELKIKKMELNGIKVSQGARAQIEKLGGKIN